MQRDPVPDSRQRRFLSCQPLPRYSNPRVVIQEHRGTPLLNWSGLLLVRQLIQRLGIASAIDSSVRMLRRCKWYQEPEHILTLIYMLTGGDTLADSNRRRQDTARSGCWRATGYRIPRR